MQVLDLKGTSQSGYGIKIAMKKKNLSIDIDFVVENIP